MASVHEKFFLDPTYRLGPKIRQRESAEGVGVGTTSH